MSLKKALNVFFVLDKNYLIHFTVTLTSLLENNKDLEVTVYIIHDIQECSELQNVITFLHNIYTVTLIPVYVNNSIFDTFQVVHYISKATYYRFLFSDILPKNIDCGLYLDCDIIITGSLKDIVRADFINKNNGEYEILAVSDKGEKLEIERFKNVLLVDTGMYFNAGVMFINLKKWREDDVGKKLIKIADNYKHLLVWSDQDVLNIYFKNKCGKLKETFNQFANKIFPEIPIVIHYSGSSKPWHYLNKHPYKKQYWKYLYLTPYKNEKFEKVTLKKIFKKYFI